MYNVHCVFIVREMNSELEIVLRTMGRPAFGRAPADPCSKSVIFGYFRVLCSGRGSGKNPDFWLF